jgi:hypothetical protein
VACGSRRGCGRRTAGSPTTHKFDVTESESLLIGTNLGIVTDLETGPNGHLLVLSQGAIHEMAAR